MTGKYLKGSGYGIIEVFPGSCLDGQKVSRTSSLEIDVFSVGIQT
jgi:hypothetical protein